MEKIEYEIFGENINDDIDDELFLKEHPEKKELFKEYTILSSKIIITVYTLVLSIIAIILIPIYKIIKRIIYAKMMSENKYVRTKKGKILAEQIAGMQNYIYDYSLLSEKDKEQIKIWDEFLVYAVLLEENEKVIDEIFKQKNMKKLSFINSFFEN